MIHPDAKNYVSSLEFLIDGKEILLYKVVPQGHYAHIIPTYFKLDKGTIVTTCIPPGERARTKDRYFFHPEYLVYSNIPENDSNYALLFIDLDHATIYAKLAETLNLK